MLRTMTSPWEVLYVLAVIITNYRNVYTMSCSVNGASYIFCIYLPMAQGNLWVADEG